jgi:hypothetical protein
MYEAVRWSYIFVFDPAFEPVEKGKGTLDIVRVHSSGLISVFVKPQFI